MGKFIDLTPSQKDEVRRLTQLANRRIKAAERAYSKAGKEIVPKEIAGHLQLKEDWATKTTPLSRSVKFQSQKDYRRHLQFLRSFEFQRPGIKEYTQVQQAKTIQALETSLNADIPPELQKKISKMSAPELSDFWKVHEDKSTKLGIQYSSDSAMAQTLAEFFPEDYEALLGTRKGKAG